MSSASAHDVASATVGPEAMSAGWSPGTSEINRLTTLAGWQAAASRPPFMPDKWRRTQFISDMLSPDLSRARLMFCLSSSEIPSPGMDKRDEHPPEQDRKK